MVKNKKLLDPLDIAYTSKLNEAIVKIATTVFDKRRVQKRWLREYISISTSTFDKALKFLIALDQVIEVMVAVDNDEYNNKYIQKKKYIQWKGFASPDIVTEIRNLIDYQDLDLEDYPIRDLDLMSDRQKLLLRKFLWKMTHTEGTISRSKLDKLFNFIRVEEGSNIVKLLPLISYTYPQIYIACKKFTSSGKIEFGMEDKSVLIYKDPNYLAMKKVWICELCGFKNNNKNKYCGGCGDNPTEI